MRIVAVEPRIEHVALSRGRSLPRADDHGASGPDKLAVLTVRIVANSGETGFGLAVVGLAGQTCRAAVEELFLPLVMEADPRHTGRLYALARQAVPATTRGGAEALSWSAVDVAMWDLKAQVSRQPLWHLLGGVRDSVPAYFAEALWPGLSADRVVELAGPAIAAGAAGLWVGVNGRDPVRDAKTLQRIREELSEDVWFGVCGHEGWTPTLRWLSGSFSKRSLTRTFTRTRFRPVTSMVSLACLGLWACRSPPARRSAAGPLPNW